MRVLVLSQYFWPESFRINEIVLSLLRTGVDVDVLTGKPNYPDGKVFNGYKAPGLNTESWEGTTIFRVPIFPRGVRSGWRLGLNYLSFVLSAALLGPWLLRRRSHDVIFVYAPSPILQALPALFIGWLRRIPVVLWVQDLWPESVQATGHVRNRFLVGAIEKVVRFIYAHSTLILVQSRAFEAPVRALASDTPIVYYPNSVDDNFARPAAKAPPGIDGFDRGFPVLFAGNIGTAQAVNVIVEAATLLQAHRDIHFVVLGDGSRRDWMLDEARKRGLSNLHLPGRFPVETMPGFMQRASVLLVTLANHPIFAATIPNKVQAYLASGRPIIASLNGEGARLIIEAEAGFAVPAEDAEALAGAVLRMYELSPDERKRMGDNARDYYRKHFEHNRLVEQLLEHLQAVLRAEKG